MSARLSPLPLDVSTFDKMREGGYVYVDKTQHAYNLITKGRRYFLSRPRRFGKSLFVSMLHQILLGKRELCNGLWIETSDYQWKKYGVISLDFSSLHFNNDEELSQVLCASIARAVSVYDVPVVLKKSNPGQDLISAVQALHKRFGAVAVLIDEYDSPILKKLHDVEAAQSVRDVLHGFFSVIKSLDAAIDFVFITGVSAFAKAGIFSGMNNLQLLTMRDSVADICGYTDVELNAYFKGYIQAWADKEGVHYSGQLEKIKHWYNGYRFSRNPTTVYNPFSVMNALHEQSFENFWFRSGTPTFLIEQLKRKQGIDWDDLDYALYPGSAEISQDSLGIFDIGSTPLPALMFQTGYLTVCEYDSSINMYKLCYPNQEVEGTFKKYLLAILAQMDVIAAETNARKLSAAFKEEDIDAAVRILKRLFAHIPYHIHMKEEKFYHALLQMACTIAGLPAHSEFSTSHGRIDIVIELPKTTYVIEIKFNVPPSEALAQIEQRKYYERFLKDHHRVILVGLSFSREERSFEITYESKAIS